MSKSNEDKELKELIEKNAGGPPDYQEIKTPEGQDDSQESKS